MIGSIERVNSGGSSGWLNISRLPSQDSLDRSIHNESGNGKSTAQVIRDLKHSNSALSAKMASQEKQYMNQLADVERTSSKRQQELEESMRKVKSKLSQYEAYKSSAESKLQQQETSLSKVKEESAFQRHTISDLKNQLYQLQTELEEAEENNEDRSQGNSGRPPTGKSGLIIAPTSSSMSTEDLQQLTLDNEELVKEIQELQDQLMQYQGYDKKLLDMQRQLEESQKHQQHSVSARSSPTPMNKERPPRAPSPSSLRDRDGDNHDTNYYRQQLQQTQGELESQKQKLLQRESALMTEKESLREEHTRRISDLENQNKNVHEEWEQREGEIRAELAGQTSGLETQLDEKNATIAELEEKLDQYAEKLSELAATLAESRQQAQNQEQYRKDEAEDLRMIQDAHEGEIARLEKDVDEAQRELELRDEELEEMKQKLQTAQKDLSDAAKRAAQNDHPDDEKKLEDDIPMDESVSVANTSVDNKLVRDLEEQLYNSTEVVNKLELQVADLGKEREEALLSFEREKQSLLERLEAVETEKKDNETEFANLKSHWEVKSSSAKEVGSLQKEIESMRQRMHQSVEAGKGAEERTHKLEAQVRDMETQMKNASDTKNRQLVNNTEAEGIANELELAKNEVSQAKEEITRLNKKIQVIEASHERSGEAQEHLREAQEALILLDEQMQALQRSNQELISQSETKKVEMHDDIKAQLEFKDAEIAELQSIAKRVQAFEAEKISLEQQLEDSVPGVASLALPGPTELDDLKEENTLLQAKLKDRDTTIATLVRSSMALEQKIEALEDELEQSKILSSEADAQLNELRKGLDGRKGEESRISEEMRYLKGQLKVAKADAKRWKRALQEDGSSDSDYRFQIAMLQKANDDFAETVQERDQAIQNLVNQSMAQEAHVRDLKTRISSLMKEVEVVRLQKGRFEEGALKAEIQRLQEESEIFAGQIIEQDEEFKRMERALRGRDEQILSLKNEIQGENGGNASRGIFSAEVADNRELSKHRKTIQDLQAEIDEMREASESNRVELRDLRRQLWEAKEAAGATNDLKLELEQARYTLDEYKLRAEAVNNKETEQLLRTQLDEALASNEELQTSLLEKPADEAMLKDLESQLEERDTILQELRNQLSDAYEKNQEEVGDTLKEKSILMDAMKEKMETLRVELSDVQEESRMQKDRADAYEDQVKASHRQIDDLQEKFQSKTESHEIVSREVECIRKETKDLQEKFQSESEKEANSAREDIAALRAEVDEKAETILRLESRENELKTECLELGRLLKAKSDDASRLESELQTKTLEFKNSCEMERKITGDLSDSQARLHALEKELSDAVSTNSSNEEMALKNQSLVQENASLSQKNEALGGQNAELIKENGRLTGEVEAMNNDNKILSHELKGLGQQCGSLGQINNSLQREKESLDAAMKTLREENETLSEDKMSMSTRFVSLNEEVETAKSLGENTSKDKNALAEQLVSLAEEKDSLRREKDALDEQSRSLMEQNMSLTEKSDDLEEKVDSLSKAQDSLYQENETLSKENESLKVTVGELKEKNEMMASKTTDMSKDIEQLKAELESLSQGESIVDEYKLKLEQAGRAREASEKSIVETYEKQLSALSSTKDDEVDELRKSLTESRGKSSEDMGDMSMQLKALEEENNGLREHLELELQAKDQQIFALEHTLHAQEQTVDSMRAEMDQLQSSMEHATKSRRGEVEEMQQEVMDVEARAMKQEREIIALKMQLEESKLAHKAEAVKLKEALSAAMENNSPLKKTLSDLHESDRMLEVRERLEQLKARNTALQEENLKLGGRLERAAIQINAFELEKQHSEEVEGENKNLRHQLKEYEQLLTKSAKRGGGSDSKSALTDKESTPKGKDKKKKKFGLFKRRSIEDVITEEGDEEEI
ncbi:MAG: hypothetical protein SGILL_000290 [Bacillariaceae sp.]